MSTIRWHIDEDAMARALIQGLRARGFDVLTPLDTEMTGEPDEAQLEFAAREGRVLYTFNVADYCRLHAEYMESGKSHAGIVVVPRQRYTIGEQLRALLDLSAARTAEQLRNLVIFL